MRSSSRFPVLAITLLLAAVLPGTAVAQTARSGGGSNAQAMAQLQQLAAERTQLQAENARLKQDLEQLRKEMETVRREQDATARRTRGAQAEIARSAAAREDAARELEQTRARLQELLAKSREIVDTLRAVESEKTTLAQKLEAADGGLKLCVDRNRELYKINGEILERLERRSGRGEPFTQIARARNENLIDEYRYRADEQRAEPATPR